MRVTDFFQAAFQAVLDLAYKQTAFICTFFIGVVICALFRVFFPFFRGKIPIIGESLWNLILRLILLEKKNMKVFITYKARRTIQKKVDEQNKTKQKKK